MTTVVDQAIAALEPLATISKSIAASHAEDHDVSITVTVGDLRAAVRAQDALRAEQPQRETFCICDLTGEPELCPGGKFCEIHQGGEFQAPPIVGKIIAGYKEKLLYFQREYQDEAGRTQVIAAATERAQEGLETTVDDRARVARMHPNASLLAKACRDIDHLLAKIADAKAALTMERRSRDRAELALLQAEPESIPIKSRAADAARQNNLLDQPLRGHPRFYQLTAAENELHAEKTPTTPATAGRWETLSASHKSSPSTPAFDSPTITWSGWST